MLAAEDLGLIMDKTIKLEWHKLANTRTRCLRITQVGLYTTQSMASAITTFDVQLCGAKSYSYIKCGLMHITSPLGEPAVLLTS
jgi:hypothetical protein